MNAGDRVQFNCDFANGDVLVEADGVGIVHSPLSALGYLTVEAKGVLWLCKPGEIRPEGTPITQEHKGAMRADQELADDFMKWLDKREGD